MNRRELKALARERIRTVRPSPLLVGAAFVIIGLVIQVVSVMLEFTVAEVDWAAVMAGSDPMSAITYYPERETFVYNLLVTALNLVSSVISVGMLIYALRVMRGIPAGVGDLFDGFGSFFRIVWINILMTIYVFLWSLLLFIPGFIAGYSYSMAMYLMLDHPDWRARDCLRESKRLMKGHKWELFVLDLSFIGWDILTLIPFVSVYVTPFKNLTRAEFYNRLVGYTAAAEEEKAPWEY